MGSAITVHGPDPDAALTETAVGFRAWLADRTAELEAYRTEYAEDLAPALERFRPLQAMLWDEGWNKLGWPTEVGGLGGTPLHRYVVAEQLATAGYVIPEFLGPIEIMAPALVKYAPHLASIHVAAGVRGDEVWCQGFSEPDAGSDLGGLRTRADAHGDGFRITGQKMWSTNGHVASWSCLLARTGAPDSGYRGLTMFFVDLSAPGVQVVPTRLANGRSDTSEIFLDDVYVPGAHVIGDVGGGWTALMYLMQFERGAYAWGRQAEMHSYLCELISEHPGELACDPAAVVGHAYLDVLALRSRARDTVRRLATGEELGPEISIDKILMSTAEQTMTESARRLLYPRLELAPTGDHFADLWRSRWSFSRITTIYGGAAEVQRDIVAERLLGLPRGR